MTVFPHHRQRGAVLVIALVMLLIITLLGIGSMREVVLESRITGNLIEQKKLRNAAESSQREAERRIAGAATIEDCSEGNVIPCYYGKAEDYIYNFADKPTYKGLDGGTALERDARWYIRFIGGPFNAGGGGTNDAGNAGGALAGIDTAESGSSFFYEVNAQAYKESDKGDTCTSGTLCLTSTTLLIKK
ncbi:pilus assembly PilX family protein [Phytopseudomonas daroniae]|uniref:pilus assembly PilX family protein n=1 Tax=Phytopseudomonas daroniae TaxID=2487519 RepID=UPI001038459E|nr:PilX N-terminal domain-containing pilus assembly protein [Pseudomonas daroniae]TBU78779.1 pilus assembly protein PilX [Pseudomonas daroniae]